MVTSGAFLMGALFLGGARLWWRHIVDQNRRLVGPPRNAFQRRAEQFNRWWGTVFLTVLGAVALVMGLAHLVVG